MSPCFQSLTLFSEYGKRGQIRTLNARLARQELLLPGFGVYASPDNLKKYNDIVIPEDAVQYSSTSVSEVSFLKQ